MLRICHSVSIWTSVSEKTRAKKEKKESRTSEHEKQTVAQRKCCVDRTKLCETSFERSIFFAWLSAFNVHPAISGVEDIKIKYQKHFVSSVVENFIHYTNDLDDSYIIQPFLFPEQKNHALFQSILYCESKDLTKSFTFKFNRFTNDKHRILVKWWFTKKVGFWRVKICILPVRFLKEFVLVKITLMAKQNATLQLVGWT